MRKTYDLKQVKISTSILWLLNKAQARKVFFSSMDIYADKSNLHLHSLIIRGLISGELYSAALSRLFPTAHKIVRTKDFPSIINFIVELDTMHLEEVSILRQKDRESQVNILMRQNPFEISEHLQMIDAIMAVNLTQSDLVLAIPNILGKLCEFRPTTKNPKKLLELWFKTISCLSLEKKNNKNLLQLVKLIITETNYENNVDGQYLETIKFSDKLALIISYDCEFIGIEEDFEFVYSSSGVSDRNNIKHNFMAVLNIFRKKFPKVLEDFKEMMLVLNSSHVQISGNMLINIDTFMLEFFSSIDEFSNHGNRTFRTASITTEMNDPVNNLISRADKTDRMTNDTKTYCSQTINKPPSYFKENFSTSNAFGTYSGRRVTQKNIEDPMTQQNIMKWSSQTPASNLLNGSRKKSLPVGLDGLHDKRMVNSEVLLTDGSLKSAFIERRKDTDELDLNKTSWLEQLEKSQKISNESWKTVSSDQEETKPRQRANETRLRLNLKRKEIERNRHQLQQKSAKELQMMSDQAFKDIALRSSRGEPEEPANYRPKRVSDMKKNENHSGKRDLVRSRSQELSKPTVDEISASIDQLKSEICKLTSEQAKLTAKLEDNRSGNTDMFSPRTEPGNLSRDRDVESRSSIRSPPNTWNATSMYSNGERYYDNYQPQYQYPYSYQYEPPNAQFYPYSTEHYQIYNQRYPQEYVNAPYNQRDISRNMTKSVQESTNSRVTSPVAISEPTKLLDDIISPKKQQTKDVEPLTVNNLLKHNESMEIITHQDHNEDWVKAVSKEDINITAVEVKLVEEENIVEITKEAVKNDKGLSKEAVQAFYVSFNDEDSMEGSKAPKKPPKPLTIRRNNIQDNESTPNVNHKTDKIVTKEPLKRAKPVAFVIPVEDKEISAKPADVDLTVKDKLTHMFEKREQEKKEKLGKIRELSRCESEKRVEKETEKEKLKQEKEIKRKAIFEAYLEKKIEKEVTEKPSRRDARLPRRLNRAVSAAPLQRNELDNNITTNSLSPPESQSPNPKSEKLSTNMTSTKLFVAPKSKSNKGVILNAIKYCCLAGKVNEDLKQQTVEDLEKCDVPHCMVLMRGGCQYRSLYGFNPETEVLMKISGMGPKKITSKMIERFYKYNSGSKKFTEINSTSHLSTVIDGITIFNTFWKSTIPSCGQLLSSETSSQAEQMSQ